MSYARKLLARGEEVVLEARQHWFIVIGRSWWAIILAILALAVLMFLAGPPEEQLDGPGEIVALVLLLIGLARIGWVIWDWRNTEFLVTTHRIVRAEGILNKRMAATSLEKVNDAVLTQSLFGRIFGFGDLDILSAAEEIGGIEDFPMVTDPVDFKVAMLNQKQAIERPDLAPPAYQRQPAPDLVLAEPMPPRAGSDKVTVVEDAGAGAMATTPAAPPPPATAEAPPPQPATPTEDATATLERLASLRDRGLITPEEYDAKKRELLERI
ncbi:MAG TPA: PH domain-containing protein [Candidatus Limnocylindria bacterium]|nr:PH domain-containing protein [Candidatus Limnocylindria bacterium]